MPKLAGVNVTGVHNHPGLTHQLLGYGLAALERAKREKENVLTGHDGPHVGVEDDMTRALLVLESRAPY
jgi:hypothetical protein